MKKQSSSLPREIESVIEAEDAFFKDPAVADKEPRDFREFNPLNHRKPDGTTDQGRKLD